MRATLAVAAREVADKKLALVGACLLGLIPLAMPLLPGLGGSHAPDARFVTALLLSLTIAVAFPILFGSTILVGDISQKRVSFYFSRPLSAAAIWAGKMLAAFVMSVCGACIVAIPTILIGGKKALSAFDASAAATVYFLLSTLVLLFGSHVITSMARLRSAWIVLDLFLGAVLAGLIAVAMRSLFRTGFWNLYDLNHSAEWLLWWLAAPLVAALLVASYAQVALGRTDARRSHGALSATLWALVALFVLPLGGLALWVKSATPGDITTIAEVESAPRGSWVSVSGRLRARGSAAGTFFVDTASGKFIKRSSAQWGDSFAFSGDGTRAVWSETDLVYQKERKAEIKIADLVGGPARDTGLACGRWSILALSASGRRLAVLDGSTLAAYDLSDPLNSKQIVAVRTESNFRSIAFVGEDTVRIFPRIFNSGSRKNMTAGDLEISELSLLSRKSIVTGRFDRETLPYLRLTADGRYLVGTFETRLTLHDGRTGTPLATLSEDLRNPRLRFLSGNRMAVAGIKGATARLILFESGTTPGRTIDLGPAGVEVLGGEFAPGRFSIALNPSNATETSLRAKWKLLFVDASSGAVAPASSGLVPIDRAFWWFSPVTPVGEAGSPSATLFLDADYRLVRLDPATLGRTVLLGRSK